MRKLIEDIAYNSNPSPTLNPALFEGNKLKPEVAEKILQIVDAFLKYAQVDVRVLDVRLVGSNAAYNYQQGSDLDIHIVTDLSKISDPETIARLYFDSIKKNFKDAYDITIKGIEVEMYVEDVNTSANSNGIYSVTKDMWIKEPTSQMEPSEEQIAEAERIESEIIDRLKQTTDLNGVENILDDLYLMRKDSLAQDGEVGAGNLAFKSLRNRGILKAVKDTIAQETSKELSLENKNLKESIRRGVIKKLKESTSPLKTLKGSPIKRSKYGVGKEIGGQIYFHKNYINDISPAASLHERAKEILEEKYPDFEYNCMMWDKSKPTVLRFDEAPDFDTAREPIPGTMLAVDTDTGEITKRYSPQIWHHKWLWVKDDYTGFDVDESYNWSKTWLQKITNPSGYMEKWKAALKDAGLE